LNGDAQFRKCGPHGVLIEEEEVQVVAAWILAMQEVGLLINYIN
jgi:hypothetical protein